MKYSLYEPVKKVFIISVVDFSAVFIVCDRKA